MKLPPELKQRITPLARRAGKTPHGWMVDALTRETHLAELREQFIDEALEAAADIDAGGATYSLEAVHAYAKAKLNGENPSRPAPLRNRTRKANRG